MTGEIKKRQLVKPSYAVAGVIELILIIALFAIILAYLQTIYIPEAMETEESEHMDEISNQFSKLKSIIDIQTKHESEKPIATFIRLNNEELPYFVTASSIGQITINDQENRVGTIKIEDLSNSEEINLTSIEYSATNFYYVDQSYILEGGGIIKDQPNGKPIMWIKPDLNATAIRNPSGQVSNIDIYFTIPIFKAYNDDKNIIGKGQCYILTNYSKKLSQNNWETWNDIEALTIYTSNSNAWNEYYNRSFSKDVKQNLTIIHQGNSIKIQKDTKIINIYYKKIYINTRIYKT